MVGHFPIVLWKLNCRKTEVFWTNLSLLEVVEWCAPRHMYVNSLTTTLEVYITRDCGPGGVMRLTAFSEVLRIRRLSIYNGVYLFCYQVNRVYLFCFQVHWEAVVVLDHRGHHHRAVHHRLLPLQGSGQCVCVSVCISVYLCMSVCVFVCLSVISLQMSFSLSACLNPCSRI